ncbi:hypothetical protein Pcinc_043726, partial [Petrolisthes cinctipes]
EDDIPIDIHIGKLVDWLVTRRHVKREWPDDVRLVRMKINRAIQDMPEHPQVTKLLSGTFINYFHCQKIIEILKETEKDSKNFLGWYGSQRMKDWQEVIKLYERENIYLAEAGHLLTRNIQYEIPYMRKMITDSNKKQTDCDAKYQELANGITEAKKRYVKACKRIGISGNNVKSELLSLLKTLPEDFRVIAEESKCLGSARQYYSDFLAYTLPHLATDQCTPLLKFVIEHGNVTTYEWTHGEPPCTIVGDKRELHNIETDKTTASDEIDFGDLGGDGNDEIDFGDLGGDDGGEIDFGDDLTTGEIDWGVGEEGDEIEKVDLVVEEGGEGVGVIGVGGGVARGSMAQSILRNAHTRAQFVNELSELEGFLSQRVCELCMEEQHVLTDFIFNSVFSTIFSTIHIHFPIHPSIQLEGFLSQRVCELCMEEQHVLTDFNDAPTSIQCLGTTDIHTMIDGVSKVLALLNTTKMHHKLLISLSPRYVDRLASSLRSKLTVCDKLAASQTVAMERKDHAATEQVKVKAKLRLVIERTRELQRHITEDMSKKCKNRQINIMGSRLADV